ncbi:MFS transporter [Gluconacetobacter tumulisoli]|uniref:MFS transporter n=1 Tax=Gluconacetobacter tumulisoli TaxID=1286189 RepID=A0A7W4PND1_9PROT|nr:MFS transporter [Gluconacetobacter tumulisoli]MBB2200756.1 MFS transporter [Gluconacetobacter tumulisoli]
MRTSVVMKSGRQAARPREQRRGLLAACLAHALHDGYTDGLYAFLPVWQSQFGLSYAGLAIVRALYFGTMGGLQMPADHLLNGRSPRVALVLSTLIAASGFAVMAVPMGFAGLCCGLVLAGVGSSIQHPRASLLVTESYGTAARRPLGLYNFSGDLGKAILPAFIALLLPVFAWRPVAGLLALLGLVLALVLTGLMTREAAAGPLAPRQQQSRSGGSGFAWLLAIGAFDTATRMGYLLFLPFLVHGRGGSSATVGIALALLFAGGALGKATCGWLADRLGVVGSVVATETLTSFLIVVTLFTPLRGTLLLLPLLGIVLNGTSSVLYGTVPELAPGGDTGRAFAVFYTGVIGAGGLAPIAYGAIADHTSRTTGHLAAAATALLIVPMVLRLGSSLKKA